MTTERLEAAVTRARQVLALDWFDIVALHGELKGALRGLVEQLDSSRATAAVAFVDEALDLYDWADIDGGDFQELCEKHGYYVRVPAGTHAECEECEDGKYECGEMRKP